MGFVARMRVKRGNLLVAFLAIISLLTTGLLVEPHNAGATRDERTISVYEIHTKETTTVTYKRNGKFVPEALKKLNWALRDWRRNKPTKMDPRLIDLVWALHKELGSKKPVHVISGYRSPKTNATLRRRGGGQARKSQHMLGKAMDVHFPDVSMRTVRNSALVRERGGVGYYPTSAIPFVHVDTARVRSWPRLPRQELAMLFPHGKTKHRPRKGGPVNARDRKKARIRLAQLARRKNARVQVASAAPKASIKSRTRSANRQAITVASLDNNRYGTMEVPGLPKQSLSGHASRLWVNQSADNNPSTGYQVAAADPQPKRKLQPMRPITAKKPLQLAALNTSVSPRAVTSHNQKLWVNGTTQRRDWIDPKKAVTQAPPQPLEDQDSPRHVAALPPITKSGPATRQPHRKYDTERVAYAPAFDDEHPDELSYRPFQILPLMSSKPVVLNKHLVALREPQYDRIYEVLASSENIPMQFRPSSRDALKLWNNQFKGNAILNLRKQAHSTHTMQTRPQQLAQR